MRQPALYNSFALLKQTPEEELLPSGRNQSTQNCTVMDANYLSLRTSEDRLGERSLSPFIYVQDYKRTR